MLDAECCHAQSWIRFFFSSFLQAMMLMWHFVRPGYCGSGCHAQVSLVNQDSPMLDGLEAASLEMEFCKVRHSLLLCWDGCPVPGCLLAQLLAVCCRSSWLFVAAAPGSVLHKLSNRSRVDWGLVWGL